MVLSKNQLFEVLKCLHARLEVRGKKKFAGWGRSVTINRSNRECMKLIKIHWNNFLDYSLTWASGRNIFLWRWISGWSLVRSSIIAARRFINTQCCACILHWASLSLHDFSHLSLFLSALLLMKKMNVGGSEQNEQQHIKLFERDLCSSRRKNCYKYVMD